LPDLVVARSAGLESVHSRRHRRSYGIPARLCRQGPSRTRGPPSARHPARQRTPARPAGRGLTNNRYSGCPLRKRLVRPGERDGLDYRL